MWRVTVTFLVPLFSSVGYWGSPIRFWQVSELADRLCGRGSF